MIRLLGLSLLAFAAAPAGEPQLPTARTVGRLEVVATFDGPMPTGVTVSRGGRIFVNFPRWGDPVDFTVAELKDGKPVAYPNAEFNRFRKDRPGECLVSVQSVVVDPDDRLWILDTGSIGMGPSLAGGPKLVGVDLRTDRVLQMIRFGRDVAPPTTYLNDVRFDLRRGAAGVAYITDSSAEGPNALIVVDLASGRGRRRFIDHPSTKADRDFQPIVEGRPLLNRPAPGKPTHLTIGADGIALSHDGKYLYDCPLCGRRLYRVRTDALLDETAGDEEAARAVEDLGDRGFASDGLEADDKGRIYLTDYEHNAVLRRDSDGSYHTLACDPRLLWPDTMSLAADGYLYVTANQLHRQARFHGGKDLRQKPYALFRMKVDAGPVALRRER
jgi:sugar lactone lactonase YvrE